MKPFFLLLAIACLPALAADTGIQQTSQVKTNGNVICTTDLFTRNGETNLMRNTITRGVLVESCTQKFYQDGVLVGEQWTTPDSSGFITEANSPYSMILKTASSNNVQHAFICTEDRIVIDYFVATNGVFYPVESSTVQAARKMTTEMQRAATPAPQ